MEDKYRVILASGSPRRKEILEGLGLTPVIVVSGADEGSGKGMSAEKFAEQASFRKAISVIDGCQKNDIIISADTVVYLDGKIMGKPKDAQKATEMLTLLSGNVHKVITGFTIVHGEKTVVSHEVTEVKFRELSGDDILSYIVAEPPFDKAGAYGIQDKAAVFVEWIKGDYMNVVGLPVFKLFDVLKKEFGISLFDLCE